MTDAEIAEYLQPFGLTWTLRCPQDYDNMRALLSASKPAAPSTTAQDERGAFEAWVNGRNPTRLYRSYAWADWQARYAMQSPLYSTDATFPCDHNYINGECGKCGCIGAGE